MAIVNKRDKSPETAELVRRRVELARQGAMRPHWIKNLGWEIYIPRRPEEDERSKIKRIDIQLRIKIRDSTLAEDISKTSGMKYRRDKPQNSKKKQKGTSRPEKTRPIGTQNPPPQTTLKTR